MCSSRHLGAGRGGSVSQGIGTQLAHAVFHPDIKKISFENFDFGASQGEKLHEQVVHQSLERPSPYTQYPNEVKNT